MKKWLMLSIGGIALFGAWDLSAADLASDRLFPTDRLIEVQLTVDVDDWDTLREQSRDFATALGPDRQFGPPKSPFTYVPADAMIDGIAYPGVGLRKKGFLGSLSYSRPSLKIKLDYTDANGHIGGLTMLTLNNNRQDGSVLCQFLGYSVFRSAGVPAPRCAFAHVTVNGKSLGVYSHVESVRKPMIRREFGDDGGTLFEGTVVDFFPGWEKSFERKFGDDERGRKRIERLSAALGQPNVELEEAIGEFVDLESFYNYWAVEGLVGFGDGYSGNSNNYFIYLNPATDRFHFIPWGADYLFTEKTKFDAGPGAPLSVRFGGLVCNRLYQLEAGRERYRQTMIRLLENHWNEDQLVAEAERARTMVAPYLHTEQMKSKRGVESILRFIRTRRQALASELAEPLPEWNWSPRKPIVVDGKSWKWRKERKGKTR